MTSKRTGKLVVAFLMFAASEADAGAKKPSAVQIQASIFGLVMEQATFADAQGLLGPAEVRDNGGDAAASAYFACYLGPDGTTLILEANSEHGGGLQHGTRVITSFQLLESQKLADFSSGTDFTPPVEARPKCASMPRLTRAVRTGAGLRLGMRRPEVVRLLGREPNRSSETEGQFVLDDKARPVREPGSAIEYPSAWITLNFERGRVVAIRVAYSSMI